MNENNQLPLRIGVGIVLLNHENNIFVGKRIDNPQNSWQMPQAAFQPPAITASHRRSAARKIQR